LKLKLFSGIDSAKLFQNVTIDNRLGVVSRRNVNTITKWLQYWRENKTHSIIYTLQIKLARLFYFTIDSLISSVVSILKVTIGHVLKCKLVSRDLDTYLGSCSHEWNRRYLVQTERLVMWLWAILIPIESLVSSSLR
jgi:hypothetical protein